MGKPTEQGLWLDAIAAFDAGMNSDVPAIDLPKNQAAFLTNATCRGNYFTHRPPYKDIPLTFEGDTESAFTQGLYQFGTYYKPDFGAESVVLSISGRIFQVIPSPDSALVREITPDGGGNDANVGQCWLWQGENYVFINDGGSPTIIFNGSSSRRADTGTVVGTVASPANIAPIGTPFAITLSDPYDGPNGVALDVYSTAAQTYKVGQFQVSTATTGGQQVTLVNEDDTPGTIYPSGQPIISSPSKLFILTESMQVHTGLATYTKLARWTSAIPISGTKIQLTVSAVTRTYDFLTATPTTPPIYSTTVRFNGVPGGGPGIGVLVYPVGTVGMLLGGPADVEIGAVSGGFTAPSVGGSVTIEVDLTSTFSDGDTVYIGGKRYTIRVAATTPSTTVYLTAISLNASVGTPVAAGSVLVTIPELPPGRMGEYGLGRNWVCLPDGKSYIASDIVGSSSGSLAFSFRDSILNVSENNYLAGGGVFRVPGAGQTINAMRFPATLDSSLGQGPLQILTQTTTFSCNAPVQRQTWQDLTNPIQTQSLVGGGALSQYSTVAVNGDLFFRSIDGIRSLKLARQDFQTSYGNTPQSVEMNRVLLEDDRGLLGFSSAIVFDNRLLMTASPTQSERGVYHPKIIAMNLDPNSSLREKLPPIYDGAWEGRNVLQLITGTFNGIDRAFAFTYNEDAETIGFTEILPTSTANLFDNSTQRIEFRLESPALFYQQETASRQMLRLNDGELIVKDLVGTVRFDVFYRPDYDTTWHTWHSWEVNDTPSWQPRMGLGQPNLKAGDSATGRPYAVGYHFQVLIIVTGSCTLLGANFYAVGQAESQFAKPLPLLPPIEL